MQAIHEYLALWDTLQDIQLNDQPDQTVWRWANDGTYSRNLPTPCCMQHPLLSWVTNSFGKPMLHCGSRSFFGWPLDDANGPETGELGTG